MADLAEGSTDAGFVLTLRHAGGVHSHISASKMNRIAVKEYRLYGENGSYVSASTDIQAQAIFAGKRPRDDLSSWGFEPETNWGMLRTVSGDECVPSEQGRYHDYYEAFAEAVRTGGAPPVSAEEAVATLAVLDAARESAARGVTIPL